MFYGLLIFPKNHDPIGIGAFIIIIHTPTVGGFCKLLVINQNQEGL